MSAWSALRFFPLSQQPPTGLVAIEFNGQTAALAAIGSEAKWEEEEAKRAEDGDGW